MELILYKNFSKRINSTKQPSGGTTVDVKLKAGTSVENPVFLIDGIDLDVNYCKWNNHYYYVNDIILGNNNIYELHCVQDLLATYKSSIGSLSAYVERSSSSYHNMFNDPMVSAKQEVIAVNNALTSVTGLTGGSGCYVLRMAGGGDRGVTSYVATDLSAFGIIFDKDNYIGTGEWWEDLGTMIFDPFKYVVSLSWCPLDYDLMTLYGTSTSWIDIKWYTIFLDTSVIKLNSTAFMNSMSNINIPAAYYSDFRRYNPRFTEYYIYIPGVGVQTLSPELTKDTLLLNYTVDINTGDIFYSLVSANMGELGKAVVSTYSANLFRPLQIGNDSVSFASIAQSVSTVGAGVMSVAGGNYAGGALTIASGAVSTAENILTPMPSVMGGDGGGIGVKAEPKIRVSQIVRGSGGIATAQLGRPCYEVKTLSSIPGFIKCGGASVNISGLASDKDTINRYLNTGFFYE